MRFIRAVFLLALTSCVTTWQDVVVDAHYQPLSAPSTQLLAPGSIIVAMRHDPVEYNAPVCDPEDWLGDKLVGTRAGRGATTQIAQELEAAINAKMGNAEAEAGNKSKALVKVRDVNLVQAAEARLAMSGSQATEDCLAAVIQKQKEGLHVFVVSGTFTATIEADQKGSTTAAAGVPLETSIKANIGITSHESISGEQLVWGVKYSKLPTLKPRPPQPAPKTNWSDRLAGTWKCEPESSITFTEIDVHADFGYLNSPEGHNGNSVPWKVIEENGKAVKIQTVNGNTFVVRQDPETRIYVSGLGAGAVNRYCWRQE